MKIDASVGFYQPSTAQQTSEPATEIGATAANIEGVSSQPSNDRLSLTDEARRISRDSFKAHHMHRHHDGGFAKVFADFLKEILKTLTGSDVENLEPADDAEGGGGEQALPAAAPLPAQTSQTSQTSQTASFQQASLTYQELDLSLSGTIKTADGKQVAFTLDLQYDSARMVSQSAQFQSGADGTAFTYSGTAAELSSTSFSFTLASTDEGPGARGHGRFNLNHEMSAVLKEVKPLLKEFISETGAAAGFSDLNRAVRSIA